MAILESLLARGLITAEQVEELTARRNGKDSRVEDVLVRSGMVRERDLLDVYAEQFGMRVVELNENDIDREILKRVPSHLVHKYSLMPIARHGRAVRIATADPNNLYALDELRSVIEMPIEPVLATRADINKMIKAFYGVGGEVLQEMVKERDGIEVIDEAAVDSSDLDVQMAQEASVVKLVNEILVEAVDQRASDIHFEPYETDFVVRYRIDGVLHKANVPPEIYRFRNAIISRIKILSSMNIAEKRLPQDGGFKIKVHGREIDLRVSVIPMSFGEGAVLRILDRMSIKLSLTDLGMRGKLYDTFVELINRPHGIVLVTGPTGSGKTTSLYAALSAIVNEEIKILTIEDPVEYYLEGINQVQVLPKVGLSFARALRAFLRHDPDVVLVGEIRDKETAEVAINASLTGHLVFSTLHTNDAVSATTRLLDMGVEPFLVASSLEAAMAQRLVRTICKHCKEQYIPEHPEQLPDDFQYKPGEPLWRGRGCRECRNTGYAGRKAVYELMVMNDELREMVVHRKAASQMMPIARSNGMKLLREAGWDLVREGLSTPEEVVRST
ncbi:MAG: GspE/PulE family protein [Phycisphaerae bacterium]|nr:GspE/PulE family protein [Phycisphaerae bacterium]